MSDLVGNPEHRFSHVEAQISFSCLLGWLYLETNFGCLTSLCWVEVPGPIKWWQSPNMFIAIVWDVKLQIKQTK